MAKTSDDAFEKCQTDKCNSQVSFQECRTCSQDASHENLKECESKLCKVFTDECFTHVSNNTVHRGCLQDAEDLFDEGIDIVNDCSNNESCERCKGQPDCNRKKLEKEYCIQCNTTSWPLCTYLPSLNMRNECNVVKPLGCYLFENQSSRDERGCISHLSQTERDECRRNDDDCKSCIGDSCNSKAFAQQCYDCDSSVDGEDCISNPSYFKSQFKFKTCKDYLNAECFTLIEDNAVRRGCMEDINLDGEKKKISFLC